MRAAVALFIGVIGLAMVPLPAKAFSGGSLRVEAGAGPYFVEIAQGCGPGFHYVGRHRNRYGAWVPGRCVRN